jgi:carboxylate-amine ligase
MKINGEPAAMASMAGMIDFGKEEEVNTRALLYELLDFIDPVIDHLGSRHRLAHIHKILENGTGADRN